MRRAALALVLLATACILPARTAQAQTDTAGGGKQRAHWRLSDVRKTFCVQWLLNPDSLRMTLPRGVQLLPADKSPDLHPALRQVVSDQPEFRSWTPSALCFYRMGSVAAESEIIQGGSDSTKAPVLGIWTVAAETGAIGPRNLALELRANSGDLRGAGRDAGLEFERLDITVGPVPRDDGTPQPGQTRYQIRFGKTLLVWDGRPAEDTTPSAAPVVWRWQAVRDKGGWLRGALTLTHAGSNLMIGSLRVEGKDRLARALQASPIRYVGPAYQGGEGQLLIQ